MKNTLVKPKKWALIDSLNLSMIEQKLCHEKGHGWNPIVAKIGIRMYKQWLYLKLHKPSFNAVPTEFIDEVWHYHILDTRTYASDCQKVFGCFLHHFPYFGIRGGNDAKNLQSAFEETKELFREVWNEEMTVDVDSYLDNSAAAGCAHISRVPQIQSICNGGICDAGSNCGVLGPEVSHAPFESAGSGRAW